MAQGFLYPENLFVAHHQIDWIAMDCERLHVGGEVLFSSSVEPLAQISQLGFSFVKEIFLSIQLLNSNDINLNF